MSEFKGRIYRSINCCKDCPDRYPACHDHCTTYQSELAEWKEKKASIRNAKKTHRLYDSFKIEAMERIKK